MLSILREGFDAKNPRVFLLKNFYLKKKYDQLFHSKKKNRIVFYSKNYWAYRKLTDDKVNNVRKIEPKNDSSVLFYLII